MPSDSPWCCCVAAPAAPQHSTLTTADEPRRYAYSSRTHDYTGRSREIPWYGIVLVRDLCYRLPLFPLLLTEGEAGGGGGDVEEGPFYEVTDMYEI
jgi:hypothetical protein